VYFGPQAAKNRTGVLTTQRAAIRLGIAMHLVDEGDDDDDDDDSIVCKFYFYFNE